MSEILYAALGGFTNSDLYEVDPLTGGMTSIGPIGFAVTGLAFDPTNGTLYGVTSSQSPSDPRSLITVDTASGAGTLIGALGTTGPAADIAFNSTGQLYGWVESVDDLYSINKVTGVATLVANSGVNTSGDGMDFDSGDVLWACLRGDAQPIYTVDTGTGAATPQSGLTGGPFGDGASVSAASFDATDVFYAVLNDFPITHLVTIDVNTGVISDVGAMLNGTDALAWGGTAFADDFSMSLTPSTLTIANPGSDTTALSTAITNGGAQSVTLSATGNPAGMTIGFTANPITSGGGTTVTVTVGPSVPGGIRYPITITGVGSLGPTRHAILTVFIPGTNSSCATATNLNLIGTCSSGSAVVSNEGMPTVPQAADPLSTVFGPFHGGPQNYTHQAWFKFTNNGPRAFFHLRISNNKAGHTVAMASGVFLNCPATAGSSGCASNPYNEWFFDFAFPSNVSQDMGAQLNHGETVWIEIAGVAGEPNPALNDQFTITWQASDPVLYDGFDDECSPPINPAVATSPFVVAGKIASYARCGDEEFAAARVDVSVGVGSLEVWHYVGGVRTVYPIAPFAPNPGAGAPANGNVSAGTPFAEIMPHLSVLLRTDGTNVWLIYYESAIVTNPYVGGTWQPWRVAVLHWNGAGFTLLGHDEAKTLNTGRGLAGVPMGFGALDAAAAAAEPGVLHVFWVEGGNSSTGNRSERVAYSKWSTSALLSQADLILNTGGSTTFADSKRLVSQYLFATNADGEIRAFYGRPLGAAFFGLTPYTNIVEMWDVTAATANIIRTVNLSTFNATYTALDRISNTGSELRIFGGSRRPCAPHVTPVIYVGVPIITGANILLVVNADGSSNFAYPEGTTSSAHPFLLAYDVEDDGRNIYVGANFGVDVWSRACPGNWREYAPFDTGVFAPNTALNFFVVGDTLYGHAQPVDPPGGRFAPIAWTILRDGLVCGPGTPIQCQDAVFNGAPIFRNEA